MHTLLLGIALITACGGMQGTLLGLRGLLEGFSPAVIGVIMSSYYLGFLLGAWAVPRSVRMVGHIRVFAALGSFASVTILLHSALVDPVWWILLRTLTGFCFSGLYLVAESWMNSVSPNTDRGRSLGTYMFTFSGGFIAGQFAVNLWPPDGFESFILASVVISAAIIPVLLSPIAGPSITFAKRLSLRTLIKASPLGFSTIFTQGLTFGALLWLSAVFGRELGYSVAVSSSFVAALMFGGLLVLVPIGRISDLSDRRHVLLVLALIASLSCALVPLVAATHLPWIAAAALLLVGASIQPMYTVAIAFIHDDHTSEEQVLAASGAAILFNGVGGFFGPILGSQAMTWFGPSSLYYFVSALSLGLFAVTIQRLRTGPDAESQQQSDLAQVMMPTSHVAVATAMDDADG